MQQTTKTPERNISTLPDVINVINVINQNSAKITTAEWRIIATRREYTRFGKSCTAITFVPGTLGYARRNKFQINYVQVVCPTTKGSIGSWYISETEAESLLSIARIAPNQDAVQRAWEAGWVQSF
jgi:hypothetical protein